LVEVRYDGHRAGDLREGAGAGLSARST
jgi:hypothetical protein